MAPVLADTSSRWGDLTLRVLSAAVLLPVAIFCVWAGGWWFILLTVALSVGLATEWVTLCGFRVSAWPGYLLPGLIGVAGIAASFQGPAVGLLVLAGGVIAITADAYRPVPFRRRVWLAAGFPYFGIAAIALPWLRADPVAGLANTLFILFVIWGSDIGAYATGRMVGGPKLAPSISPGKTWSGAIGGLMGAVLSGFGIAACLSSPFLPSDVTILAIGLGLAAQAGDLLESALKRHFGVKDSGHIIPGHGGLLDCLDSLVVVAPIAAVVALYLGRGVVLWR